MGEEIKAPSFKQSLTMSLGYYKIKEFYYVSVSEAAVIFKAH